MIENVMIRNIISTIVISLLSISNHFVLTSVKEKYILKFHKAESKAWVWGRVLLQRSRNITICRIFWAKDSKLCFGSNNRAKIPCYAPRALPWAHQVSPSSLKELEISEESSSSRLKFPALWGTLRGFFRGVPSE